MSPAVRPAVASAEAERTAPASTWWRWAVPVGVGVLLAVVPPPARLAPGAWRYFALFAAVVAGLMVEPVPAAAVGFIGMALGAALRLVAAEPEASLKWALSGFANGTVWLIFSAFMFTLGYERTGLGRRVALGLVKRLGGSTLGLGYAVMLADVVLAPFTPSNTARSAGTIFPIIRNIPPLFDSHPGPTSRRLGAYIMWVAFATTTVTSSMFATALAPNILALDLVSKGTGLHISMAAWALGFAPVGIVLAGLVPWLTYKLYPPLVRGGRQVPDWAEGELRRLGPVTWRELAMAGLAVVAVGLWMAGAGWFEAATVALLVIAAMVVLGIVEWREIAANHAAWNVLVLMATLVALADGLNKVGFVGWFTGGATAALAGVRPAFVMAGLVAVFFLVHYMFASVTAHATAVLPVVLAAGAAVPGVPLRTFALLLCYSLGVMGVLTPYATGPAPVYFASGFVPRKDFWTLGLVFGLIFLATLLAIGIPFLMVVQP
jgi:L-tartrate/succinate antiporter